MAVNPNKCGTCRFGSFSKLNGNFCWHSPPTPIAVGNGIAMVRVTVAEDDMACGQWQPRPVELSDAH